MTTGSISSTPPQNQRSREFSSSTSRSPASRGYSRNTPTCPRCRQFNSGHAAVASPSHRNHASGIGSSSLSRALRIMSSSHRIST